MRRSILVSLAFCYLLAAAADPAGAQAVPHAAPVPDLPAPTTGFSPPPVDLTHVRLAEPPAHRLRDLPSRFDWREHGQVSPVQNQGPCGSCYAFAAAGDVESRVLRDLAALVDISENHLKECHFEQRGCQGGNAQMMVNLLTLEGAVQEACDPYVPDDVGCTADCDAYVSVLDWVWLAGNAKPAATALKQALLDHGPLSTTMFAGDGTTPAWQQAFNQWSGGDGLHYAGAETPNHAVMLVGWDDDHPHTGGGEGCWIVKNSWGAGWGDACDHGASGGYCYLAYDSANLGMWTSAITEVMPSYPELTVMAWDEGGWTGSYGGGASTVTWGLARFASPQETNLHRVEFWTNDATVRVDVYVYQDFTGGTLQDLLAAVEDLSFEHAGYHSVPLDEPLAMAAGTSYHVAVRLQNLSYTYPLPVDQQGAYAAERTWISLDGGTWYDLGAMYSCEAGIRIRTSPHTVLATGDDAQPPATPPTLPDQGFALDPAWPNPFNPATSLAFTLDRPLTVNLRIYDLQGRLVRTLVAAERSAGRHHVSWSGRDDQERLVPAGVYLCRLDDGQRTRSRRLVLLK